MEVVKWVEEELLFYDIRCWLNGGVMLEVWYFCIGVFVLYVVVVKGYIEVMRLFF